MKVLIDGDILAYHVGFFCEDKFYTAVTDDGLQVYKTKKQAEADGVSAFEEIVLKPKHEVDKAIETFIETIVSNCKADDYEIFITETDKENTFRFKRAVTVPYKGTRKQSDKPKLLPYIKNYIKINHGAQTIRFLEADDFLGICQTDDTIIATVDKDMWQIPGLHYNIATKEIKQTTELGELELRNNNKKLVGGGFMWLMAQMLMGDKVDNIVGVPGYGPVKTFNTLEGTQESYHRMLDTVYRIYESTLGVDRFWENADLLYISHPDADRFKDFLREYDLEL